MIHPWSFAITPHCEWIGTKASNFGQVYFMWKKYFKIDNRECVTIEQHDEMAGLGRWADRVDSDTPDMEPVPCLVTVNPQQQWKGCGRCGGAVVGLASCCWRCGMPATSSSTQWSYSRHYQLWQQPDAAHHHRRHNCSRWCCCCCCCVGFIPWQPSSVSAAAPRVTLLPI